MKYLTFLFLTLFGTIGLCQTTPVIMPTASTTPEKQVTRADLETIAVTPTSVVATITFSQTPVATGYQLLENLPFTGVIIPPALAAEFVDLLAVEGGDVYWLPDTTQILEMEHALIDKINGHPKKQDFQPMNEYFRQYAGLAVHGEKVILGNFFCPSSSTLWMRKPLVVMDGGACFFRAEYDVEKKDIIRLDINGEA